MRGAGAHIRRWHTSRRGQRRRVTRRSAGVLAAAVVTAVAGLCSPALGASPRVTSARSCIRHLRPPTPTHSSATRHSRPRTPTRPPQTCLRRLLPVRSTSPATIGQWSAPFTPANSVTAVHMVLMDTGKVLEWTMHYVSSPATRTSPCRRSPTVYDPVTRKAKRVPIPRSTTTSSACTQPRCPTVTSSWSAASTPITATPGKAYRSCSSSIPSRMTWTVAPSMHQGRWYPSVIHLADGRDVAIGGHLGGKRNAPNYDVEAFPATGIGPQVVAEYKVGVGEDMYPSEFQLAERADLLDRVQGDELHRPSHVEDHERPGTRRPPVHVPERHHPADHAGRRLPDPAHRRPQRRPADELGATTTSERIDMSSTTPAWTGEEAAARSRGPTRILCCSPTARC